MDKNRSQTGIRGLDENLQGGFPKGSMILIAGNPGTGKTMFSGEFLYHGATRCQENGLYVSFSEGRATFIDNMRKFGRDFHELEKRDRFEVLDLITVKEPGIDAVMEMITTRIEVIGAKRLVIDSFTAMANAFSTVIEARVMLHLLSRIVRQTGCTTLLVTEIPTGLETIGMGIEEFVVDGIIILRKQLRDGYTIRKLEIAKMRGTRIDETRLIFTLHEGFKVLTPLRFEPIEKPRRFTPISNPPDLFSTGNIQLDEILGGFRRGDTILVELGEDISPIVPFLMFGTLEANFITSGMGVLIGSSGGMNVDRIINFAERYGITREERELLMRILVRGTEEMRAPCTIDVTLEDVGDSFRIWNEEKQALMKASGKPVLKMLFIDIINEYFSLHNTRRVLEKEIILTKNEDSLLLLFSSPGSEELQQYASKMSDLHLRLFNEQGVILFHGTRPRTTLYALETTDSEGYPKLELTPLI